jgi:hypothetical protein
MRKNLLSLLFLAIISLVGAANGFGQDDKHKHDHGDSDASQKAIASKSAKFETVAKSDKAYTGAIDAHDLSAAGKMVGHSGAFKGKVAKLFTPRGGSVAIINFDSDYKSALTAVVKKSDFSKFPELSQLDGKEVVVSGEFSEYKGSTQILLSDPKQVAIVK